MTVACSCTEEHTPRRVVVTGGPGAGKTALLELVRHAVCRHVHILPESAGIVFGGGFPREEDPPCRQASQRAIFHVQRELEEVGAAHRPAIVLCDRGTVDGVAYWPGDPASFWTSLHADPVHELGRYDTVIHLRTPPAGRYNHRNPLRTESAAAAAEIDARILDAWSSHPRRIIIESSPRFIEKAVRAIEVLHDQIPDCCAHGPELHR